MASNASYKNPPTLEKTKTYQQWKNEVKLWELVTDLELKKRGLALALSLQGKPREVALEIDPVKLNADDGVKFLVTELDKLIAKDKVDQSKHTQHIQILINAGGKAQWTCLSL